ncbi:MAG: SDR family NAD(P)-dependent oxidoreductase [Gemmataceae bacterium]
MTRTLAQQTSSLQLAAGASFVLIGADDGFAANLHTRGYSCHIHSWNDVPVGTADNIAGLIFLDPAAPLSGEALALRAFRWMQWASTSLRKAGQDSGALLVAVTRRGGQFGLENASERFGDAAGLAGLVKTARHEWPEVHCKVIDIAETSPTDAVVGEILSVGPIEVGVTSHDRFELVAERVPQASYYSQLEISENDVVVVSGGGRGVTSAVAIEMARVYRPVLILLGRTSLGDIEAEWLAPLQYESELKAGILSHWPSGRPTPRDVDREYRRILAEREIRSTMEEISKAGSRVEYLAVDIRSPKDVAATIANVRTLVGPIRGIIHGAGVLADKRIEDKTVDQFKSVYETKVDGLQALLAATRDDPLAFVGLFSSSTGRFGRTGQADYSAANEVLNATARILARERPQCHVVAFNWGPWDGGMVTPALRKIFAQENVGVIPIDEGAKFFVAELSATRPSPEIIVLGPEPNPRRNEVRSNAPRQNLVFRRELSVSNCPVLESHMLGGRAILPMALALEWLAHAAMLKHPGMGFMGCDNLRALHTVAIDEAESVELTLFAGNGSSHEGALKVPMELHATHAGATRPCYRAEIVLGSGQATPPRDPSPAFETHPHDVDDSYSEFLFHGPDLRGLEEILGSSKSGILVSAAHSPPPSAWFKEPLRGQWLAEPLVLDCALQAMILWTWQYRGDPSLPCGWSSYRQYRPFPTNSVRIACRVTQPEGLVKADIDFIGPDNALLASIRGCEHVVDANLRQAFTNIRTRGVAS